MLVLAALMALLGSATASISGPAGATPRAATGTCQAVGGGPGPVGGPNRATVVIDTGSGPVWSACVSFSGTISGLAALDAARAQVPGLDPVYEVYAGNGRAVCRLRGTGNDPPDCLSKSAAYWAYFRNGGYSRAGAGSSTVSDGDTEGWRWGTSGGGPRAATNGFRAAAAPPPMPAPRAPLPSPPRPSVTQPPARPRPPASPPATSPRPTPRAPSVGGGTQAPNPGTNPPTGSNGGPAAPGRGTGDRAPGSPARPSSSTAGGGASSKSKGTTSSKAEDRPSTTESRTSPPDGDDDTTPAGRSSSGRPSPDGAKSGSASDETAAASPSGANAGRCDTSTDGGTGAGSVLGFAVAISILAAAGWFLHRRRSARPLS